MRIDALNAVSQLYQSTMVKSVQKKDTSMKRDSVSISEFGHDLQVAKQALAGTSDVRPEKVADIKQKMAAGTYNVPTGAIADKLLGKNLM
ncbi:MAG: flagellar biosynthesis anti-sigma factor FlgM [Lachnospiraceae bacterium]|nr:flagellar biosynthesis anti-sigma factor FlgM [Lachnospiraceae bacterium]